MRMRVLSRRPPLLVGKKLALVSIGWFDTRHVYTLWTHLAVPSGFIDLQWVDYVG